MSERLKVRLAMTATVIVTTAVCAALMLAGWTGELIAVAMIVVGGTGVHLTSVLIVRYAQTQRR
ncbi:MAG TPA: hypothetical protein VFI03_08015 [Solirubrobacterales bacterium]|nr:hypothetical protein [Solirubrobacterales bacterium]